MKIHREEERTCHLDDVIQACNFDDMWKRKDVVIENLHTHSQLLNETLSIAKMDLLVQTHNNNRQ